MATVTITARSRTKGKSYIVQYVDPETGKKRYHATYRRKDMAVQEAAKLRILLDEGTLPKKRRKKRNGATFCEIAEECKTEWRRRHREGDLSKATFDGYVCFLKPLVTFWGNKVIGTITKNDVLEYRADVAFKRSRVLANRRLFIIKQVFAKALELKAIEDDFASDIRYLSEKAHERKKFMYPEKVDELLAAAAKSRAKHYLPLAILLAVEHGASKQEILDLKWSDICFRFGNGGTIRFFRTKTGVERIHRIMPRTRQALLVRKSHLKKMRRKRNIDISDEYVVGRVDGSRINGFRSAWKSVCNALGLTDFHFHDNRHTYCSNIIMAGGTLKHAKEMIGHKTLAMADRYSHLEAARENLIQDSLADHYTQRLTGASAGKADT